MDLRYTQEQQMLADSLRRVVGQHWSLPQRRARQAQGVLDPDAWRTLAELGVLGLSTAPVHDGDAEPPASLLVVHRELGRGLVAEPVIASGVMAAAMLAACETAVQARWLPPLASGETILTLAYLEPGRRYERAPRDCRAVQHGPGWRLEGSKHLVWHGAAAQAWLVCALDAAHQPLLLAVPADAPGVQVWDSPTLDGTRCARLDFSACTVGADALLARGPAVGAALDRALLWGNAALCAHAAGAMERLLEITVEYLRTRQQFGRPLASFQALRHRVAQLCVDKELGLSMAYVAAAALSEPDPRQGRRMAAAAQLEVARAGRQLGQWAVQLHGGIGMSDELEVGDYFKRLTTLDMLLGDSAEQLTILAEPDQS